MVKELRTDADIDAFAQEVADAILAEQAASKSVIAPRKHSLVSKLDESEYSNNQSVAPSYIPSSSYVAKSS